MILTQFITYEIKTNLSLIFYKIKLEIYGLALGMVVVYGDMMEKILKIFFLLQTTIKQTKTKETLTTQKIAKALPITHRKTISKMIRFFQ